MTRHLKKLIPLLARTAIISAVLAAPVLAVPLVGDHMGAGLRLEAPKQKKMGVGFVLLVSLQRG